jgi:hypothetical protein
VSVKDKIRSLFQRLEEDEARLVRFSNYQTGIAKVNSIRRKLRPVRDGLLAGARVDKHSAIAAACEASRRTLGLDPFDEQVGAALAMSDRAHRRNADRRRQDVGGVARCLGAFAVRVRAGAYRE